MKPVQYAAAFYSIHCTAPSPSLVKSRIINDYDHHDDDNDDNGCVVADVVDTWSNGGGNSVYCHVDDSGRELHRHCSRH